MPRQWTSKVFKACQHYKYAVDMGHSQELSVIQPPLIEAHPAELVDIRNDLDHQINYTARRNCQESNDADLCRVSHNMTSDASHSLGRPKQHAAVDWMQCRKCEGPSFLHN